MQYDGSLDEDAGGDISLSGAFSRPLSRAHTSERQSTRQSPSLLPAALSSFAPRPSGASQAQAPDTQLDSHRPLPRARERDVSAPVPQRLFGRSLFARSPGPEPSSGSSSPAISSSVFGGGHTLQTVSLNDEEDAFAEPEAGPSRLDENLSRRTGGDGLHPAGPGGGGAVNRPVYPTRRASSGLGRSRSLNVKLPSSAVGGDVPTHHDSPMSATSSRLTPSSKIGWSRRPGEPHPPPLVGEATARGMSRWVKEVVVCNFDLERGPVVERRAGGRRWGLGEKENVAFSSFPDTSLFSEGSILFSFKIRHIPPDPSTLLHPEPPSPMPDRVVKTVEEEMFDLCVGDPPGEAEVLPGGGNGSTISSLTASTSGPIRPRDKAEEYRKWDERGREWLYGFVWFEQRRDKGITRGYMQKSLVILTHLPFPALFFAVLQRVAPVFFEYGYSALEAACQSISTWPDPVSGSILELPMMSDLIAVKLPDTTESPQLGKPFGIVSPSIREPLLASLPTSTPLRAFASCLPSLWSLWECLILAEPVLIIAPDPRTCSEIVWWLRDLLRPIPPAGDFRPYLHIHDHDFSLLVNSNKPQAGIVVGVTNPFFRNAASHWPNVISIPAQRPRRVAPNGTSPAPPAPTVIKDTPEGFISRRHRSVQKDRTLLKRLEALAAEGKVDDPEGNEALRTHFQQLTERFLVPLNRYFQTLVPTLSSPGASPTSGPSSTVPSPGGHTPSIGHTSGAIRPFSIPSFLSHLRNHGPNPLTFRTKGLSSKSRVESDFYASFCMSPTFAKWLEARVDSLGFALQTQSQTGNTLTVPGQLSVPAPRTPSKRPEVAHRPSMPRSQSASVGLGILGSNDMVHDGRRSPVPLHRPVPEAGSESEVSTSETDSVRFSEDGRFSQGTSGGPSPGQEGDAVHVAVPVRPAQQREREGSGATIVPPAGWYEGRRASEGMVKFNARGSLGR
ncbi:hypothetical protein IAU60_004719 [Kwoniella sp. DSM 27419]